MAVKINLDACIGCGACVGTCPTESLSLNADDKSECNEDTCIDCGACVGVCPTDAISQ